jgi:cellulose synthase/poly-beta-1,6-N-acetylglucosamine synthase-like glycosyltransferase
VRLLFFVSMSLVAYTYVGYPLVLWMLTRRRSRHVRKGAALPSVSIIVTARNEADKIRRKIEHSLTLDYPKERLEILVASDASDDGTDEIVKEYAARGVRLVRAPQRKGKEHAQGLALAAATGDIIVMTDAATILQIDALRTLVENFSDPSIGAVSSEDVILDAAGNPTAEGVYVKYEMWVRRLESRFHSLVGLSGSCFAIRKELCSRWPATLASDFMAALHAARAGYRAVADASARGRFIAVTSAQAERRRKVRTFLRGITVLMANLDLLNPFRYGRFAFQLASHKLLRFAAPLFLLTALATSGLGFYLGDSTLRALFVLQVGSYVIGLASGRVRFLQRYAVVRAAHFFIIVQWAMLMAWGKYALGQQQTTWEPTQRQELTPEIVPQPRETRRTSVR